MSFFDLYQNYKGFDFKNFIRNVSDKQVEKIINSERVDEYDLLALLSERAEKFMELMAVKAKKLTADNFGKVIFLFTPIYLSNYCINHCAYCGFNAKNEITRMKLDLKEVETEARAISVTGLKHILILTGESRKDTPISYIKECIKILRMYFSSVSIEIYPLEIWEYEELAGARVDGLTIYQEVYNEETYDRVHVKGPKKNYKYRIDAPERGCRASIRSLNIGVLLGLEDFRSKLFFTALHVNYYKKSTPVQK